MNSSRAWLGLGVLTLCGVGLSTASCGSDETVGGAAGAGGGIISGGSAGSSGGVGRSGTGGDDGGVTTTFLGQACVNDAECGGAPLICLHPADPAWGTGGPPQGLCTVQCSQNSTCDALSPGAGCFKPGADGYCLEGCVIGTAGATNKCHNRGEFACTEFTAGQDPNTGQPFIVDLCAPGCNGDLDCGGGTYCDPDSGMCVKTPKAGDPEGTPCDPNGVNTCKGLCLQLADANGPTNMAVCADRCTTGSPCLYDSSSKPHGACFGPFALSDPLAQSDIGDFGWCVETCNCDANCNFPGDKCDAWQGTAQQVTALTQAFNGKGMCVPTPTSEITTCTGAGGTSGSGGSAGTSGTGGAAGSNQ